MKYEVELTIRRTGIIDADKLAEAFPCERAEYDDLDSFVRETVEIMGHGVLRDGEPWVERSSSDSDSYVTEVAS